MIPTKTQVKSYQLTKPSFQKMELEMKSSLLKPTMKTTVNNGLRKK